MPSVVDALGTEIELASSPRRIVSLVPSFTELVAALRLSKRLVGVTRFCTDPAEVTAAIRKVGGTKNPDIERIIGLEPDIVLANREENREDDVLALRDAGLAVYVGDVRTAAQVREEIGRLATFLGAVSLKQTRALDEALEEHEHLNRLRPRVRVACLIWRNPYMAAGGDTYIGDLLRLGGGTNVFETRRSADRYPRTTLAELAELAPDLILLPDEPLPLRQASPRGAARPAPHPRGPGRPRASLRRPVAHLGGASVPPQRSAKSPTCSKAAAPIGAANTISTSPRCRPASTCASTTRTPSSRPHHYGSSVTEQLC